MRVSCPSHQKSAIRTAVRLILGLWAGIGLVGAVRADHAARSPADPSEFEYQPLPAEGALDLNIGPDSPVFEFHSGKSPFKAFRLPVTNAPYLIDVISYLANPDDLDRARVFYPVVALLSDDMVVTRTSEVDALRFDLPVLERSSAPAYRLTLAIDPTRASERYLVIFTDQTLIEHGMPAEPSSDEQDTDIPPQHFAGATRYGRLRVIIDSRSVRQSQAPAP
jgi:hypothetical protein